MGRHTGNKEVVHSLQNALRSFLKDHRNGAEKDPEWIKATGTARPQELADASGCGCEDCIIAGQLLGNIY